MADYPIYLIGELDEKTNIFTILGTALGESTAASMANAYQTTYDIPRIAVYRLVWHQDRAPAPTPEDEEPAPWCEPSGGRPYRSPLDDETPEE